jgi:hypothetical protein
MKSNADYQRAHRQRTAAKLARIEKLEAALRECSRLTGDKQGAAAVAIRAVCLAALGGE